MLNKETQAKMNMYLMFFLVLAITFYVYYFATRFTNKVIRIDNDNLMKASTSGNRSKNLVSDTDGTLYRVTDAWGVLHFRSAEVLNTLRTGEKFIVSGYGTRVPALGLYPVIVSATPYGDY